MTTVYAIISILIAIIASFAYGRKRGKDDVLRSTQLDIFTTIKDVTKKQNNHANDDISAVRERMHSDTRDQS